MPSKQNSVTVNWTPQKGPQYAFFTSPAFELLFGGSAGGSKTESIIVQALANCIKYPGYRAIIFRRTFPEIQKSLVPRVSGFIYGAAKSRNQGLEWEFPNGSMLYLSHLQHEDDKEKHKSSEYDFIGFDELTSFSEASYMYLFSRCRGVKDVPRMIRSGSNPSGPGHCVPYGEVLTRSGWKRIQDVGVGEEIATMDENESFVFRPVSQVHSEFFEGDLVQLKNKTNFLLCTPNHKLVRRTETKNGSGRVFHKPSFQLAKDISASTRIVRSVKTLNSGLNEQIFHLPKIHKGRLKHHQPRELCMEDFCELMGWFLSEGFTVDRDKMFGIAQSKAGNRLKIERLLRRCGFTFSTSPSSFTVYSPDWWEYLKQFGKCREKYIPRSLLDLNSACLTRLFDALMAGDGCEDTYYTISKQLAEDIQEIGLRLGFSPVLKSRQRKNRVGLSYEVTFRDGCDGVINRATDRSSISFSGPVYCLGIEGLHRFFLRQNGFVWLSGNSWVRSRFVDHPRDQNNNPKGLVPDGPPLPYDYAYGWRVGTKAYTNFSELPDKFAEGSPIFEERTYQVWKDTSSRLTRAFLPSLLWGNEKLLRADPEYVARMRSLDEKTQAALLYGSWDIYEGQFFSTWDPDIHVVDAFPIPSSWRKYVGIDYGYTAPFAAIWAAVDNDGNLIVYREAYASKLTTQEQAQTIKDLTADEKIEWYAADPSMFSKSGMGESHAQIYHREGVPILPSSNKRVAGWAIMHEYLSHKRIRIFRSCTNLVRTIPTLTHSRTNPEDLDSQQEDHAVDALRYLFLTLRGTASPRERTPDGDEIPEWFTNRIKPMQKRIARVRL